VNDEPPDWNSTKCYRVFQDRVQEILKRPPRDGDMKNNVRYAAKQTGVSSMPPRRST